MLSLGVAPSKLDSSITHLKFEKLKDLPFTKIKPVLQVAVDFITSALAKKGKILVHCFDGVSLSASCVIAYIMNTKKSYYDYFPFTYVKALSRCY